MSKNRCVDHNNPRLKYEGFNEDVRVFKCPDCGQYHKLIPISDLEADNILGKNKSVVW